MSTEVKSTPAATASADVDAALARDIAAHQQDQQHRRHANAEPLPGPLAIAFTIEELTALGFTIRPVVASDFILLKKLDSPLYRQVFALAEHTRKIKAGEIPKDAPPPETKYDEDECVEMIYQFTRPLEEVRRTWRRGSNYNPDQIKGRSDEKIKQDQRDHFREVALAAITDALPIARMDEFPRLVASVVENFTAAFSTSVPYGAPEKDENQTVFTTRPGADATASAGGGTTSPGSAAEIPPDKNS